MTVMTWVLGISRGWKRDRQTELPLESHHLRVCGPGVIAEGLEREKKARARHSRTREAESFRGKEGVKGEKRGKDLEGRAVFKLQKASDGCCCRRRQPWPLYRCFCSPLALCCTLLSVSPPPPPPPPLFAWCLWWSSARGAGGYQSHRCLLQTSKPGAPVRPSAPIIISARPERKASYTGGEIFDLSSSRGSTVTQTTGVPRRCKGRRRRREEDVGGLAEGGRGQGKWGRVS